MALCKVHHIHLQSSVEPIALNSLTRLTNLIDAVFVAKGGHNLLARPEKGQNSENMPK